MENLKHLNEEKSRRLAKQSLFYATNNKKHICETLRLTYDEIHKNKEKAVINNDQDYDLAMSHCKMTELLIDAMEMAKKMQDRLAYYQKTYKDNTGNKAINIIGLTGVRARAKMRKDRLKCK